MALVSVTNIIVEDNPCPFLSPLKLKITFECVKDIEEGCFFFFYLYKFVLRD